MHCFFLFWLSVGTVFWKIAQKGGTAKEGDDLWQRLRAKSAREYPQTLKIAAQGSPGLEKYHPMAPLDPKNHRLGHKNLRKTLLSHNWAAHPPEESPGTQNNQNSTLPQRKNTKQIENDSNT